MKNIILLLFSALLLAACSDLPDQLYTIPDIPNIAYIGRFGDADKTKPVFMYSGCAIKTVFKVTSAEIVGTRAGAGKRIHHAQVLLEIPTTLTQRKRLAPEC
jgi:hypothetical protein